MEHRSKISITARYSLENYLFCPLIMSQVLDVDSLNKVGEVIRGSTKNELRDETFNKTLELAEILIEMKEGLSSSCDEIYIQRLLDKYCECFSFIYNIKFRSFSNSKELYDNCCHETICQTVDMYLYNGKNKISLKYPNVLYKIGGNLNMNESVNQKKKKKKKNRSKVLEKFFSKDIKDLILSNLYEKGAELLWLPSDIEQLFFELDSNIREHIKVQRETLDQ